MRLVRRRARDEDGTAAIGPDVAAAVYDLQVLVSNIEDRADNATRFLVVGRQLLAASGDDKTTAIDVNQRYGAPVRACSSICSSRWPSTASAWCASSRDLRGERTGITCSSSISKVTPRKNPLVPPSRNSKANSSSVQGSRRLSQGRRLAIPISWIFTLKLRQSAKNRLLLPCPGDKSDLASRCHAGQHCRRRNAR